MDNKTLNDLLRQKIRFCTEYRGNYYIRLEPKGDFDETIWRVSKLSKKAAPMHITEYFQIHDKAKEVSKETLLARR